MPKVQFIFAIHNHQPVGNFEFIAEEAYRKSYLPFLTELERHPKIKIVLHYTGILYQFFEGKHPEFIDKLKKLVAQGRAEILSGGMYEPITAIIPDADKVGQIRALSDTIQRLLGYHPQGMWLAERVWEPHLPTCLAQAGINHLVVDDFHFKQAGLHDDELDGYYVTEEQNHFVKIFPGSEKLRYLIPFRMPEETIELLKGLRSSDNCNRLMVMADDGEKFGVWPETYRSVYEEGWLDRFFSIIEQNSEWLETTTFSEYLQKEPARGRVYLPTASYMEMGEWALPPRAMKEYDDVLSQMKNSPDFERMRPFIKGGIWRNFLAKYSESNHMQKRMMMVSSKVHDALAKIRNNTGTIPSMLDHLYQSQCNDAYWHGVFGGLYLPHLRSGLYEHLIQAEYLADAVLKGGQKKTSAAKPISWLEIEQGDFDGDGREEVMLNSERINVFIDPGEGGTIRELDWKPCSFNLTNSLTRRQEVYHTKIHEGEKGDEGSTGAKTIHERVAVKEKGLQDHLHYDWYTRGSLIDHFPGPDATLPSFLQSRYPEMGDFVSGEYQIRNTKKNNEISVALERKGLVSENRVVLKKDISLLSRTSNIRIQYRITNESKNNLKTLFGSEFNFSFLAGDAQDRYYDIPGQVLEKRNLGSQGETDNVKQVRLIDEWLKITLTLAFSEQAFLWRGPIHTVSQSESGFERVFQSSLVMPIWNLSLQPGQSWETEIMLKLA
ncbi:MAG: alpha-amylase/4-alpha-glucanotransferase domain-containing protein [Nitrospirota bacterium]